MLLMICFVAMENNRGYIHIDKWMITELGLRGNEVMCFAIIYGFSQDGSSRFNGSQTYLAEMLGVSRRQAINILTSLLDKDLIFKEEIVRSGVKYCEYAVNFTGCEKFSHSLCEKISHNNKIDNNKDISLEKENIKEKEESSTKQQKKEKRESSVKEKKENIELPYESEEFIKWWQDLLQEPKWKTKSVHSLKLNLADLKKMGEEMAIESIKQTIKKGWQGVFEVKGFAKSSGVNLNANSEWDD